MLTRLHAFARVAALGVSTVIVFGADVACLAQEASEYQVKAAYLYNFAKFVDWPAHSYPEPAAPLRFCVLSDPRFELALRQIVQQKTIGPHPATVDGIQSSSQARSCHVLFISAAHAKQAAGVLEELKDTSVLTVGETKGFLQAGGIINFLTENEHVLFQVNERAAVHQGLQISSRLLSVASLVLK